MHFLVPSFHHDIAYLRSEREYTAGCMLILDEAIRILSENPDYCYFIEQAWLLEEYWDARPQKRGLLRKLAEEGRLCMEPGFYAVPDMTLPDGESIYMQAAQGRRIVRNTLGIQPSVAMITDCWGHHAQLPQILSQCGYDYYAFSRCMRPDVDRQNFVWRGVDGSKLKTHWMSTHYDGIRFPTNMQAVNADELEWADAGEKGISELMSRNSEKCGEDPQYLPVGGDMVYPSAQAPGIVRTLNERGRLPKLVFAAPARALGAVDWERAHEYTGEFMSSQQGSFTTNIWIKQMDRKQSGQLYALEALSAAMDARKDFSLAWKMHLKNQFHDIICGTICNEAVRDAEADFRTAGHALTQIQRQLTGGAGEPCWFNALPFERWTRTGDGLLKLPPMGCAAQADAHRPAPRDGVKLPLAFENKWYRAQVSEKGYITSLIEQETGCELVAPADEKGHAVAFGSLSMQMDYGDSWWTFDAPMLDRAKQGYALNRPDPLIREDAATYLPQIREAAVVQADEDSVVIRQQGEIRFWMTHVAFTTTITLSKSDPEIIYRTEFVNECKNLRLRAAFPVRELTEKRRQIPYAIVPFGQGEQTTQMFMDAQNERAGLAVINHGTPAGNIEDGVMLLSLFRSAAMEYKCDSDLSYNLGRAFAMEYAVCPHVSGNDRQIWESALALNTPVIPCQPLAQDALPVIEGAMTSCIRETEDGLFIRLYNPFAEAAECRVKLPAKYHTAFLTDGLAQAVAEEKVCSGQLSLRLDAYKVQGILLRS